MIMPVAERPPALEREAPLFARGAEVRNGAAAMPHESVEHLVRLFRLLSDETRLRILFYLSQRRELHVRALCDLLGQSQPAVSHHLALLRDADIIRPRRQGKHNFYRLSPGKARQMLTTFFTAVHEGEREIDLQGLELRYLPGEQAAGFP
jgi:ArsR family transcriptional regulator